MPEPGTLVVRLHIPREAGLAGWVPSVRPFSLSLAGWLTEEKRRMTRGWSIVCLLC